MALSGAQGPKGGAMAGFSLLPFVLLLASAAGLASPRVLPGVFDLAVLGAGPTGITAAVKAAQLGHRAIVIDDPGSGAKLQVGGPSGLFSKALRDVSKRLNVQTLRSMGLRDSAIWSQASDLCRDIALVETQNTVRRLQRAGVPRIQGCAAFEELQPDGTVLLRCTMRDGSALMVNAKRALVATGSKAWAAPGVPLDGRRIFDSDSIKRLTYLPTSVVITGSGIIAIEFAKIFATLGAKVLLLVRGSSLDSALEKFGFDAAFGPEVQEALLASGIKLRFDTEVVPGSFVVPGSLSAPVRMRLRTKPDLCSACAPPGDEEVCCDLYMLAAGRDPNSASLNLGAVGATLDARGALAVDRQLCAVDGVVWGAGDVLGPPSLASTGIQQATAAIAAMFGTADMEGAGLDYRPAALVGNPYRYPVGIWTTPEISYFGQSPKQAARSGVDIVEGIARYTATLRGHVNRCTTGTLKLVVESRGGAVIGVFIFGDEACELIHYGMEIVNSGRTVFDVRDTCFAAVTYHELFTVAADDAIRKLGEQGSGAKIVARGLC
mmetsp:Transcript_43346/g.107077  ORF Transcript_43346/g.107077 Transcript_43346/m.107077 type:complete len:549 (+) Transcript_43346:73-1719(+)